ncbi:TonB family protein [Colwellia sp. UCD-KL20]|uniref:TonB family protein n=1 Tax=Colwellia sp. UCD-KL20 TaxID=1917165 RepID=UPI0009708813|nr:TonB family protein [Colwellia sp. UCD-KL20]
MQESFLNSPLIYSIAHTLIHFLWQGVLVALVLKTLLVFTPNQKSQLRYAFASGAMILNLILPLITFFIIFKPDYLQLSQHLSQTSITGFEFTQIISQQGEWYSNVIDYLPYLTFAWLTVISILSLKLLFELYSVNQLPKQDTLIPDADLLTRFQALSLQIGIKKVPTLLISLNTSVPMAIGWIKPIVLIPVSMLTGLTPTQLDMLILHELAHIRRYDYIVNFIQSLVEIILFFHPCVIWVSNQMRNEREYCSDDIAVKHCGNPIAYAHTLADTASLCNKHRHHSIPSMAMAASGGDLTQRVLRLVNEHHCSSNNQISKWFASLTILSVILFISSQQLITQLEVELTSSSYTPIIEVPHNKRVLNSNNELFNKNVEKTNTTNDEQLVESRKVKVQVTSHSIEQVQNTTIKQTKVNQSNTEKSTIISKNKQKLDVSTQQVSKDIEDKLVEIEVSTIKKYASSNNKSISQLAFKQTKLNKKTSLAKSAYSKQLAELNTELNDNDLRTPAKKLNMSNSSKPYQSTQQATLNSKKEFDKQLTQSAELIYSVPPRYPSTAKRKGIELEVKVDFTIDAKGNVKDIVFPTVKHKINYFKTSVRLAIEKWRFKPAKNNGEAIDSKMSKIFSFSLHE